MPISHLLQHLSARALFLNHWTVVHPFAPSHESLRLGHRQGVPSIAPQSPQWLFLRASIGCHVIPGPTWRAPRHLAMRAIDPTRAGAVPPERPRSLARVEGMRRAAWHCSPHKPLPILPGPLPLDANLRNKILFMNAGCDDPITVSYYIIMTGSLPRAPLRKKQATSLPC